MKHTSGPHPEQLRLEEVSRSIGRMIGEVLPPGIGFSLNIFTFGEGGFNAYISNAQRADMIKMMRELLGRLDGGMGARDTES